jgi:hypothetical protein
LKFSKLPRGRQIPAKSAYIVNREIAMLTHKQMDYRQPCYYASAACHRVKVI